MSAAEKAEKINFNLSGMDLSGVSKIGAEAWEWGSNAITAAELKTILKSPELLAKTVFYRDGKVVTAEQVLKEVGL